MHYFFTNLACRYADLQDVTPRSRLRADRKRGMAAGAPATEFSRSLEETERSIQFWFDEASLFYERQTVAEPFRVVLRYHEDYATVTRSFVYPRWAELSLVSPDTWLRDNVLLGEPCMLSRVDSDDSFANDYVEYLAQLRSSCTQRPRLVVHRISRQFHVGRRELSIPLIYRKSLAFATILVPSFDPTMDLTGVVGHHHSYVDRPHFFPETDYALQRITDRNAFNAWGVHGWTQTLDGGPFRTDRCDRYAGCGEESNGRREVGPAPVPPRTEAKFACE